MPLLDTLHGFSQRELDDILELVKGHESIDSLTGNVTTLPNRSTAKRYGNTRKVLAQCQVGYFRDSCIRALVVE